MNVVPMRQQEGKSPLAFAVTERPMTWEDHRGKVHHVSDYKVLLRAHPTTREPLQLAVVGAKYRVVQNRELYGYIDEQLPDIRVEKHDAIAYGGAWCRRDYIFPSLQCRVGDDDVAFRARVINGFGTSAILIAVGAITFACDNGIILGQYERVAKKHTAGLSISGVAGIISNGIGMFETLGDTWVRWLNKEMTDRMVEDVLAKLVESKHLAPRKADMIKSLWSVERASRGANLWAFYNAFTFYASHVSEEGSMALRDTGNDHQHSTLHKREIEVHNIVRSDVWKKLAA